MTLALISFSLFVSAAANFVDTCKLGDFSRNLPRNSSASPYAGAVSNRLIPNSCAPRSSVSISSVVFLCDLFETPYPLRNEAVPRIRFDVTILLTLYLRSQSSSAYPQLHLH